MNPIRAALTHRQVVMVLTMLAVLVGLQALFTMSRREDPKITIRTGLVVALYPGATAAQVEDQLARKVEQRLFRYAQVRKGKTYSTSRPGALIVNVELENDVTQPDEFWAMLRHDLNELRVAELPSGVLGPVVDANFGDVVAVLLAVRGNGYGNRELSDVLDQIDGRLRTIDAVSKIRRVGERQEELRVTASSARLAQFGVSVGQVSQALRARNAVVDAGAVDVDPARIPLRATGLLDREADLRRLLVGTAPSGVPAYLEDLARVERRYQDPQLLARVNGQETVLLAVEMHEGRNIVAFGKELRDSLDALRHELPQDVVIDLVADQPTMVEHRMLDFGKEFAIAVVAVIMVTVLLLPFRVAAIAAIAIPITVLVTIAVLNVVGVELHQISFAGLVVALGMVVDDAIVIADNYVEQLDHGTPPSEAAWRGATELAVPVLTATLTIVASFLPLAFLLPGSTGEFLKALPITVVVALLSSYVIAMFLTPVLCLVFIKTGLHAPSPATEATSTSTGLTSVVTRWIPKRLLALRPLDAMQHAYERLMAVALPRKALTIGVAVATLVAGVILLGRIPGQFFPFAERNQFVVDVWLREGSRIEATDSVMRTMEGTLQSMPDVQTVSSFVGASAPRFYYNVNPEPPTPNYGQILVNTATAHEVPAMAESLRSSLAAVAPGARVLVKELQQGPVLSAPVEVRLIGDDPQALRAYGDTVAAMLEAIPSSRYVHDDWREDAYGLSLELKRELASRLGFSDASIAEQMAAGFEGVPVSTFWEGKRQIPIVFRLDEGERGHFEDVADMYVASPLTGARVPLHQVAHVRSDWQQSRIVRRNGVRTLTVRAFAREGFLPSQVLAAARPALDRLALPLGVRMTYGGEAEAQAETMPSMATALGVSLLGIFLILLLQFRNVKFPLLVMVSIPLSLFGAALGLLVTGNPLGFTAQLGMIALTGVVVRNAIILVDFINERRRQGEPLQSAALDAGRRRLRPIFLTTMAAAVGVVPMILSGSSLWGPLASVLAVGLVCSMVFTLVVVPVLYVMVEQRAARGPATRAGGVTPMPAVIARGATVAGAALALLLGTSTVADAQAGVDRAGAVKSPLRLTIDDATQLALEHGYAMRIASEQLAAATARARGAKADLLPRLSLEANALQNSNTQRIILPQGSLGEGGAGVPVPNRDTRIAQSERTAAFGVATLSQPLTTLIKVRHSVRLAGAQVDEAGAARDAVRADVSLAVERLFAAALVARRQLDASDAALRATELTLGDAQRAQVAGTTVSSSVREANARVMAARYERTAAIDRVADLDADLRELLGVAPDTPLELVSPQVSLDALEPLERYLTRAESANPELRTALTRVEQAQHAVRLARADFIPDVGLFVSHTYQDALALLPDQNSVVGVRLQWTLLDFGKRSSAVAERFATLRAARVAREQALAHTRAGVEKAYRRAARAESAAQAAIAALDARTLAERDVQAAYRSGLQVAASQALGTATRIEAEVRALEALLALRIARAELARAVGEAG